MNPILVDINAYVAFKRGDPEAIVVLQQAPLIGMNTVVVGELLGGFRAGQHEDANRDELEEFLTSSRVSFLPIIRATAEQYAIVFARLKAIGKPIPTNDLWIAASAFEHGLNLFTFDRHFQVVARLHSGNSVDELSGAPRG